MPKMKRGLQEGTSGGEEGADGSSSGPPPPVLKKRCRSFDLEIRGCRHLQEFVASCVQSVQVRLDAAIETAVARITEDVTKALTNFLSRAPSLCRTVVDQSRPPRYRLKFMNCLDSEIFTKKIIHATNGQFIKICVLVNDQQEREETELHRRILSAKIKVVVLDGDFNKHNHECWTQEEFQDCIVLPRDNIGSVLTGISEVTLKDGEAFLSEVIFNDISKFVRSGKFRLGVMVTDNLGERILEGITEPFVVKDRRGEGSKKHDIPLLNDGVWRLKKIRKDGVFHDALKDGDINSVKDFLTLYYKDEEALRKIVGTTFGGNYTPFIDLDMPQKKLVQKWSKEAYKYMSFHQHDYILDNGKPRPLIQTAFHDLSMLEHKSTELMQGPNEKYICQTEDHQDTLDPNSGQCKLKRLGSLRVTQNNDDASFDFSFWLDPIPEQYSTSENDIAGSVTLHCAPNTEKEITGSVVFTQPPQTMDQQSYSILPFPDDDASAHQLCEENQQVRPQFGHSLSSITAALFDSPIYSRHSSFKDSDCHQAAAAVGAGPAL